jgi:D-sedoheptulose 7-phosphate isomerase
MNSSSATRQPEHIVDRLLQTAPQPSAFARGYLSYLADVLRQLDESAVAAFIHTLVDARERGAHIFFFGNGGSAATASHFANDIAVGSRSWDKPFRAISLTDNVAMITAIANDYGYEEIFVRQLSLYMRARDVVVAISASGNSPNVLRAVEYANTHCGVTVGLTGFDGGQLQRLVRVNVHAPTVKGEYGPTEDVHMILDHLVGAFLIGLSHSEGRHFSR